MTIILSFLLVMVTLLLGVCRAYLFDPPHLEVRCCVFRDQIHIPLTHLLRSIISGPEH